MVHVHSLKIICSYYFVKL